MVVAIMQPTYLPWMGYLAMIDRADVFVFLDDAQFARRSWQQRNRIKTAQGEHLLTIPVHKKGLRDQTIRDAQIQWASGFADQHARAIELAYARAPHFAAFAPALLERLRTPIAGLADFNIALTRWLLEATGLRAELRRSSEIETEGAKASRLCSICQALEAATYLAAPGSREYLDASDDFARSGIAIVYHEYRHPVYAQLHGEFLPYMASIDALLNIGSNAAACIRSGVAA